MINYLLAGIVFVAKTVTKGLRLFLKGTAWYLGNLIGVFKEQNNKSSHKVNVEGEIL